MNSFNIQKLAVLFAFGAVTTVSFAGVEINGDAVQEFDLKNGVVAGVATGEKAEAKADVNKVEGNVTIKGDLKQKFALKNGALTAVATGKGAKASATANTIIGK